MRLRLSSLLILMAVLAVTIGLGFQVYSLRQEVADLRAELPGLRQRPAEVIIGRQPGVAERESGPDVRFQLLNGSFDADRAKLPEQRALDNGTTKIGVPWSIERAMMIDAIQRETLRPIEAPQPSRTDPVDALPPEVLEILNRSFR